MNCKQARKYLAAFQDNELDVRTNIEVLEHVEMCDRCAQRLEAHRRLTDLIASHVGSILAPEGLKDRVAHRILSAGTYGFWNSARWREVLGATWVKTAAAAASIIIVFGFVYGVLLAPPAPLNVAAAREHRAWLSEQVPNFFVTNDTDKARKYAFVKFVRKPATPMLDNGQVELVGAGTGDIESMNVGHFVFRYKGTTVSMFIFEGFDLGDIAGTERQAGRAVVKVDSRQGMNLVAWNTGNFAYILVSSLPQSDLLHISAPVREAR